MDDAGLGRAVERAEQALGRIERAVATRRQISGRDEQLRARVRDAVSELDQLIRAAGV